MSLYILKRCLGSIYYISKSQTYTFFSCSWLYIYTCICITIIPFKVNPPKKKIFHVKYNQVSFSIYTQEEQEEKKRSRKDLEGRNM